MASLSQLPEELLDDIFTYFTPTCRTEDDERPTLVDLSKISRKIRRIALRRFYRIVNCHFTALDDCLINFEANPELGKNVLTLRLHENREYFQKLSNIAHTATSVISFFPDMEQLNIIFVPMSECNKLVNSIFRASNAIGIGSRLKKLQLSVPFLEIQDHVCLFMLPGLEDLRIRGCSWLVRRRVSVNRSATRNSRIKQLTLEEPMDQVSPYAFDIRTDCLRGLRLLRALCPSLGALTLICDAWHEKALPNQSLYKLITEVFQQRILDGRLHTIGAWTGQARLQLLSPTASTPSFCGRDQDGALSWPAPGLNVRYLKVDLAVMVDPKGALAWWALPPTVENLVVHHNHRHDVTFPQTRSSNDSEIVEFIELSFNRLMEEKFSGTAPRLRMVIFELHRSIINSLRLNAYIPSNWFGVKCELKPINLNKDSIDGDWMEL
ncbi:hypothetical protein BS50DRAFT_634211 [Corynespora cassiicola Philippines]|uniref:F-box domain-containing protein n=1 Tax=Corynespora cassiicola Philippines TaxID=1448308 RepID=A0A2T2NN69_CORCC|nr:hypothetical protein BS50DRAFT_634211 [Corynespora cassiicola Philippines]